MSVLIDTSLLVDYLTGDARAARVLEGHQHASITAITWLEVMAIAPADRLDQTRAYLRTFERLSISEPIADEALRLLQQGPGLSFYQALSWATAILNHLVYITVDAAHLPAGDAGIVVPYRRSRRKKLMARASKLRSDVLLFGRSLDIERGELTE